MSSTARLNLPHLVPGQMQKEVTHNEALERLELAVQPVAIAIGTTAPPSDASLGDLHVVRSGASGAWAGRDAQLAMMGSGGWIFLSPFEGLQVSLMSGGVRRFQSGSWQIPAHRGPVEDAAGNPVVGQQQSPIASPTGGGTQDSEARAAIADILSALRSHGLIAT